MFSHCILLGSSFSWLYIKYSYVFWLCFSIVTGFFMVVL